MQFPNWLRERMEKAGDSEYKLAEALSVHRMTVYYWRRGSRFPGRENFLKLCERYREHPNELARRLGVPLLTQSPLTGDLLEAVFSEAVGLHEDAEFAASDSEAQRPYEHARNLLLLVIEASSRARSRGQFDRFLGEGCLRAAGIEQIIDLNQIAVEHCNKAEATAVALNEPALELESIRAKANSLRNCGDVHSALHEYQRLVRAAKGRISGHTLRCCANTLASVGKAVEAEELARKAIRAFEAEGSTAGVIIAEGTLGEALRLNGRLDEAEAVLKDAVERHYESGVGPIHRMVTIRPLAALYRDKEAEDLAAGRKRQAKRHLEQMRECLAIGAKIGKEAGLKHQMRKFSAMFGVAFEAAQTSVG